MYIIIQELAVKLESHKARHPQLLYESKLYKILQGGIGIPHTRFVIEIFKPFRKNYYIPRHFYNNIFVYK